MKDDVISLEDIFYSLKKRWKMILIITILSTVVAGVYSFYSIKPIYTGRAKIFIGKEGETPGAKIYDSGDISFYKSLMTTYIELIKTKESTKKALNTIGKDTGDGNVARVLSNLSVTQVGDTQMLDIGYTTGNKDEVVEILTAVTNTFMLRSKELIPNGNIQVIQPPQEPRAPLGDNKARNTILGLLVGLMVSVGIVFLREYLDNSVKKTEELEELLDIPVIGSIPNFDILNKKKKVKFKRKNKAS